MSETEEIKEEVVEDLPQEDTEMQSEESVSEKMLPQSEVNRIIAREKREAKERAKREAMAELERQTKLSQMKQQSDEPNFSNLTEADVQRLIEEQAQKQAELAMATKTAHEFMGKLETAKPKYEDFDDVIQDLDLPSIPEIAELSNMVENTGDVIYELGKNPSKLVDILTLHGRNPKLAERAMKMLSDSIRQNDAAQNQEFPDQPLKQFKRSAMTSNDNNVNSMSISDLRNMPWLRG